MSKLIFKIDGMCCAEEMGMIKKALSPLLKGKEDRLSFDLISEKMMVEQQDDLPTEEEIVKAVATTGMKATPWKVHVEKREPSENLWQRHGQTIMTGVSALSLGTGFVTHAIESGIMNALVSDEKGWGKHTYPPEVIALYAVAMASGGCFVLPKALRAILKLRPDMNLLMTTAIIGAAGINQWFEGATASTLFSASLLLEAWNVNRARQSIRALVELSPTTARVVEVGQESVSQPVSPSQSLAVEEPDPVKEGKREITSCDKPCNKSCNKSCGKSCDEPSSDATFETEQSMVVEKMVEDVPVGSIILVRPGEKIPMDSILISGITDVNQAPITGESMPVRKDIGDELFAGTINGDTAILCQVTRVASDSTLSRIISMVEEAQSRRATSEQFVENFARYYTPSMMVLAMMLLVILPTVFGKSWEEAFYQALEILVIACPCALVVSTPVSIAAGLNSAAHAGVLIKGGKYLEAPSRLKAVAFDKTGTLTSGEPTVQEIIAVNEQKQEDILKLALSLEEHSDHPLARAIRRKAKSDGVVTDKQVKDFRIFKGKGAEGYIDDTLFWIGSYRLLQEKVGSALPIGLHNKIQELESSGHSVVAIGYGEHICGLIGISDAMREGCKEAMQALKKIGIEKIIMLTGDNQGSAKVIAESVGIDDYQAELLPEDKVKHVETLVQKYQQVAMVGDGINDAPAMAMSSLSIAMGAAGSDAAMETADIALMSDDLSKLAWLINHSRRTLAVIKQNIVISLSIKGIFMGLALANKSTLGMAIAADMGASFIVVFNGLRLLNNGMLCWGGNTKIKKGAYITAENDKQPLLLEQEANNKDRIELIVDDGNNNATKEQQTENATQKSCCANGDSCSKSKKPTAISDNQLILLNQDKIKSNAISGRSAFFKGQPAEKPAKKSCCANDSCSKSKESSSISSSSIVPLEELEGEIIVNTASSKSKEQPVEETPKKSCCTKGNCSKSKEPSSIASNPVVPLEEQEGEIIVNTVSSKSTFFKEQPVEETTKKSCCTKGNCSKSKEPTPASSNDQQTLLGQAVSNDSKSEVSLKFV